MSERSRSRVADVDGVIRFLLAPGAFDGQTMPMAQAFLGAVYRSTG